MSSLSPLNLPDRFARPVEQMAAAVRAQRATGDVLVFVDVPAGKVWMKRLGTIPVWAQAEAGFVRWLAEVAIVHEQAVAVCVIDASRLMRCSALVPGDAEAAAFGRTLLGRFLPRGDA